jgi:hypothetical protein
MPVGKEQTVVGKQILGTILASIQGQELDVMEIASGVEALEKQREAKGEAMGTKHINEATENNEAKNKTGNSKENGATNDKLNDRTGGNITNGNDINASEANTAANIAASQIRTFESRTNQDNDFTDATDSYNALSPSHFRDSYNTQQTFFHENQFTNPDRLKQFPHLGRSLVPVIPPRAAGLGKIQADSPRKRAQKRGGLLAGEPRGGGFGGFFSAFFELQKREEEVCFELCFIVGIKAITIYVQTSTMLTSTTLRRIF